MAFFEDFININPSVSNEKTIAENKRIGGSAMDMSSKTRTVPGPVSDPAKLPKWNYAGEGDRGLQAIIKDALTTGKNIPVMDHARISAVEMQREIKMSNAVKTISPPEVAWPEIEQEYPLLQKDAKWLVRWPGGGFPGPRDPYYCGVEADKAFGRNIVNTPYKGDWNGAGAHTNYSTKSMKKEGGMEVLNKAIEKLGFFHKEPTAAFGEGNEKKPTGGYGTADISLGVADSGASIRVGCDIEGEGKCGPFLLFFLSGVCSKKIVQTRAGRMAGMMAQAAAKAWGKSGRH